MWLHLFALLTAASTFLLIYWGGLVKSTESGLSVPDWPNTYGWFMFTFPLDKMVGGIYYEHGHRLIASVVGFLILVMAVGLWRVEPRAWVRKLGYAALAAVIVQGILGGLTVLFFLPPPISISHAGLAQIVCSVVVALALFTSRGWRRGYDTGHGPTPDDPILRFVAAATVLVIFVQILVGATMRHLGAGLAIPDFPWVFGGLVPPQWTVGIAVHYAHRVGAVIATLAILATTLHVFWHLPGRRELRNPSLLLLALLAVQITLGAYTVLSQKHYIINSLHVVTGAAVLATSVVLALRVHRSRFPDAITQRTAHAA